MRKVIHTVMFAAIIAVSPSSQAAHEFHHPNELIQSIKTDKNPGKSIYDKFCATCHNIEPLIEINAPKFRHFKDWQPRLKQDPKQLLQHTTEGLNNMPPMGGCFECSDELIQKAINYMLPQKNN